MVMCFDCPEDVRKVLEALLEGGRFRQFGDAIGTAVENGVIAYVNLRRRSNPLAEEPRRRVGAAESAARQRRPLSASTESAIRHLAARRGLPARETIPSLFAREGLSDHSPRLAQLSEDAWTRSDEIPIDRWVFGQYNKLLPAKATCRAIAHLMHESPNGVLLDDAVRTIPEQAWQLGDYLADVDHALRVIHDDRYSTAFPVTGRKGGASCARYAKQFVAAINERGELSGLPYALKLLNHIQAGKRTRLQLTEVGWRFALLSNPVLDAGIKVPGGRLGEEEIALLLEHVRSAVPPESFAYRTILAAVEDGANTPSKIDAALERHAPQGRERKVTKEFLSSQRSGAISRMVDVGLIERVRDAARVSYRVTPRGSAFLSASEDVRPVTRVS